MENKIVIATLILNEHLYLEEWIQYHLKLVDEIYIAEDYKSKSHKEITDKYPHVHLLSVRDVVHEEPKAQARQYSYNEQMNRYFKIRKDIQWAAFIDVDEFIHIEDSGKTLREVLREYEDDIGVKLAWKMYGANGRVKRPEGMTVQEAYPKCSPIIVRGDWYGKTIVNIRKTGPDSIFRDIHSQFGGVYVDHQPVVRNTELANRSPVNFRKLWIDHYFTKSFEDWLIRLRRGNMQNHYRTLDTFFIYNPDMLKNKETLIKEYHLDGYIK